MDEFIKEQLDNLENVKEQIKTKVNNVSNDNIDKLIDENIKFIEDLYNTIPMMEQNNIDNRMYIEKYFFDIFKRIHQFDQIIYENKLLESKKLNENILINFEFGHVALGKMKEKMDKSRFMDYAEFINAYAETIRIEFRKRKCIENVSKIETIDDINTKIENNKKQIIDLQNNSLNFSAFDKTAKEINNSFQKNIDNSNLEEELEYEIQLLNEKKNKILNIPIPKEEVKQKREVSNREIDIEKLRDLLENSKGKCVPAPDFLNPDKVFKEYLEKHKSEPDTQEEERLHQIEFDKIFNRLYNNK